MATVAMSLPRRLLRWLAGEPFVHFLALGALIFIAFYAMNTRATGQNDHIEVGANDVTRLRALAVQQWGREPDARQMDDLVQSFVREEVLVREALASGMDRDDVIVRRRLAQKMEFLAHDDVRSPDETEQRAYQAAHPERYQQDALVNLEHLFFSTANRGAAAMGDAQQALAALERQETPHGDNFMLGRTLSQQTGADLARDFGTRFATAVMALPTGAWSLPLESSHGLHVVRVTRHQDPMPAPFAMVQAKVAADMVNEMPPTPACWRATPWW
jgi:peptidyl-prolyl cis-trans isomerase C